MGTRGVAPLCLRQHDTDLDGELEWVGLYLRSTEPPQLLGFVLDGNAWYDLCPPAGEDEARGLGAYPACELETRDINGDGRIEIVVWGRVETNTDLLHIFSWDGTRYALLGIFEGPGGVRLANETGDTSDQVLVRLRPENGIAWEIVYAWDGTDYAWVWDRYTWFYPYRPHAYVDDSPLHALASFYLALADRDLPGAFGLLSPAAQAARSYDDWAVGFSTTLDVEVGAPRVVSQEEGWARVAAQVQAVDNVNGRVVTTLYDVEWQLIDTEAGWRLDSAAVDMLDQWEMPYYP